MELDLSPFPRDLHSSIRKIAREHPAVSEVMVRRSSFRSDAAALIAAFASDPAARRKWESRMQSRFEASSRLYSANAQYFCDELVIGSGLHAAIYATVRYRDRFMPPTVIEAHNEVGGAFAVSKGPSFYLNSTNRPGETGPPGTNSSLNHLPGSPIQLADITGAEYGTNADISYLIRNMLTMHARQVRLGWRALAMDRDPDGKSAFRVRVDTPNGMQRIYARRIVIAKGLGKSMLMEGSDETARAVSFPEFMRMMDNPWPLLNMKRVAVIGGGDSAKAAVEALIGQGPACHRSMASVDHVEQIDWYGAPYQSCEECKAIERTRYVGIARELPSQTPGDRKPRIKPILDRPAKVSPGYETAVLYGINRYDYVIQCMGQTKDESVTERFSWYYKTLGGGRRVAQWADPLEIYRIGPDAGIAPGAREQQSLSGRDENKVAIFRYADRTATLAAELS